MEEKEKQIEIKEQKEIKDKNKLEQFSFSKLEVYLNCPYSYKLKYIDKHYTFVKSLALEIGILIHYIYDNISHLLINNQPIDYDFWKKQIYEINKPNTETSKYKNNAVKGLNLLEEDFVKDFITTSDKSGLTYTEKVNNFLERLKMLEKNHKESEWKILATEVPFSFVLKDKYEFKGSIDRIDINENTQEIRIIDYKTKDKPFEDTKLTTPLQMVIYSIACGHIYQKVPVEFIYDLCFLNLEQVGGTKGFIDRGTKKIEKTLESIENKEFAPSPSPMCYWCDFSATNKDASETTKRLCPYYSLWTPTNKVFNVNKKYNPNESKINNIIFEEEKTEKEIKKETEQNTKSSIKINTKFIDLDKEDF